MEAFLFLGYHHGHCTLHWLKSNPKQIWFSLCHIMGSCVVSFGPFEILAKNCPPLFPLGTSIASSSPSNSFCRPKEFKSPAHGQRMKDFVQYRVSAEKTIASIREPRCHVLCRKHHDAAVIHTTLVFSPETGKELVTELHCSAWTAYWLMCSQS